ncbi:MAG: AFG1 family ATPase, partial [Gammaproteobacteria bacterium]
MTLLEVYERKCHLGELTPDDKQRQAVMKLDALASELTTRHRGRWWHRILPMGRSTTGLYLWGGVGRGKTMLMDLFYAHVAPKVPARRQHFHRFMYWTHQQLARHKGEKNPLEHVAAELASEIRLLCFDEFFVSEIGDAMILGRFFEALFGHGVVVVATSNIPPERLYWKGLHRGRFLPTIDLIKRHMEVVHVDSGNDYRLRELVRIQTYHTPADEQAEQALMAAFQEFAGDQGERVPYVLIQGREVPVIRVAPKAIWTDFSALCEGPRAAADYIEIARLYPCVILSGVPVMT